MANYAQNEAFTALYNETYDAVLKYIVSKCGSPDDIPDIIQRTYLSYYERIQKGASIDNPAGYLFKIAKNEMNKHYRLKAMQKRDVPVFSKTEETIEFEALEALLVQELPEYTDYDMKKIWQYVKDQGTLTFQIFVLYFYYDEKLSDIAATLKVKESTVKNRLYRTIDKMREQFRTQ